MDKSKMNETKEIEELKKKLKVEQDLRKEVEENLNEISKKHRWCKHRIIQLERVIATGEIKREASKSKLCLDAQTDTPPDATKNGPHNSEDHGPNLNADESNPTTSGPPAKKIRPSTINNSFYTPTTSSEVKKEVNAGLREPASPNSASRTGSAVGKKDSTSLGCSMCEELKAVVEKERMLETTASAAALKMSKDMDVMKAEKNQLLQTNESLHRLLKEAVGIKNDLSRERNTLKADIRKLTEKSSHLESENQKIKMKAKEMNDEKTTLQAKKICRLEKEVEKIRHESETAKKTKKSAAKEIDILQKALASAKEDAAKNDTSRKDQVIKLQAEKAGLLLDNEALKTETQNSALLISWHQERLAAMERKEVECEAAKNKAEADLFSAEIRLKSLRQEKEQLTETAACLVTNKTEQQRVIQELMDEKKTSLERCTASSPLEQGISVANGLNKTEVEKDNEADIELSALGLLLAERDTRIQTLTAHNHLLTATLHKANMEKRVQGQTLLPGHLPKESGQKALFLMPGVRPSHSVISSSQMEERAGSHLSLITTNTSTRGLLTDGSPLDRITFSTIGTTCAVSNPPSISDYGT